ncbi:ATP-dependent DNA helicase Q4-like [Ascaphus truei]|uniref:ATP-dependent DNA helicase Q4-like n=1 Tax=Ascaphus truei TaxID=8439 RepID=UPI003F5AC816
MPSNIFLAQDMQRYKEVKLLLKSWESDFLAQHRRKPSKVDVENAPEETQNLYKEYRTLKLGRGEETLWEKAPRKG